MSFKIYFISTLIISLLMLYIETINKVLAFLGTTLIVSIIVWKVSEIIKKYLRQKRVISPNGKAVIITGCDTGFGNGLAFELNALGFYTIALCLDAKGDGVKQLINKAIFANKLITLELDITQESQIDKTFDEISQLLRDNGLKLWALVNNAGIFDAGYVEWGNGVEAYQRLLDVNTLGTIRMTRKYLPLLRETGGRVVNVLSVAARLAIDGYSAYCVSKHASLAFNDSLRREMFRFGVKVISVEPSCYRTPIAHTESVNRLMDRVWSQTSSPIREDYGPECVEHLKSDFAKQVRRARDPIEVINALKMAISCEEPEIRYKCCGLLANFITSSAELLPIQVFDSFWRTIHEFEVFSK